MFAICVRLFCTVHCGAILSSQREHYQDESGQLQLHANHIHSVSLPGKKEKQMVKATLNCGVSSRS